MSTVKSRLQQGDSVVVREGTVDPGSGVDLAGWRGRISDLLYAVDAGWQAALQWDSVTLERIPPAILERYHEVGLSWSGTMLPASRLALVEPRDYERDVEEIRERVAAEIAWSGNIKQGRVIEEVLEGVDAGDEWEALEAWESYLAECHIFPFDARVSEVRKRGPLRTGDRLFVKAITVVDELYGIVVEVTKERGRYDIPLSALEAAERASPAYTLVEAYGVWFANR